MVLEVPKLLVMVHGQDSELGLPLQTLARRLRRGFPISYGPWPQLVLVLHDSSSQDLEGIVASACPYLET